MDVRLAIAHHIPRAFLFGALVMGVLVWLLQSWLARPRFNHVMLALLLALLFALMFGESVLHPGTPDSAPPCNIETC
jgi:uncharacterized membrane protein AbrB (regulator of aidB expression)